MLEVLVWSVLGLTGCAVLVLAMPVDLMVQLDLGAPKGLKLRIGWLFGLVSVRWEPAARKRHAPEKPKDRKEKRGARTPSSRVLRRALWFLGDLLGRVRIRRAELDLTVGTDDPATTGELAGWAVPFVMLANALPRTSVTLTPNFSGPTFEGVGEAEIRFVPLTLVPPMIGFALAPEVRQWLFCRR